MKELSISSTRLKGILSEWRIAAERGEPSASKCDALVCVFGEVSATTLENQRSQAILQYLFGSQSPVTNVGALLTEQELLIIKQGDISVTSPSEEEGFTVRIISAEEAKPAVKALLSGKTVGAPLKEFGIQEGPMALGIIAAVKEAATEERIVEAAPLLGELLFKKDPVAQSSVEKSAGLCSAVFRRYARPLLEEQAISDNPMTLHDLREQICAKLEHPSTIPGLESLNATEFSMAAGLTPCVFHKGTYLPQLQIDPSALQEVTNAQLVGNVVVVRYGAKHFGYTALIGRTLIVESRAPADAKSAYEFVLSISDKTIESLTAGARLQEVYANVMRFASSQNATLAEHLSKSLGFSTGLLVLESRGAISEKGTAVVGDGMCFVVRVILEKVPDGEGGTFDIELADTVVVSRGAAELKTKFARKLNDIVYEDAEHLEAFEPQSRDLSKITRHGASETVVVSRTMQREEELKKLLLELHAEFLSSGGKKNSQSAVEEFHLYDIGRLSFGEISGVSSISCPQESKKAIFLQSSNKVVWFPIAGEPRPFHVSTVSKCDVKSEGDRFTMTVTFHAMQETNIGFKLNRTKVFLKELSYASSKDVFTEVKLLIQAAQQRIKNDDALRKRNATSASAGKLALGKIVGLPQVKLRPVIATGRQNKACVGNLELHQNGLRFTYLGGVPIDILFDNIKHVIFQPSVQEICVIYHITLKKTIEVGRKSVTEIQFVAEVMESSEAATGVRRSHEEEINAEVRDENRAKETNKQFITFARAVEEKSRIKTQLPTSQFSFGGVHARSMVKFRASREVLWAVSDWPVFTQRVDEIEVVSLERVIPGGSTFDMSFVLKDYSMPVVSINSIPKEFLESIKDWCLMARLYYMETTVNPNWKVTLKDIRDDPEWDPWLAGAGWSLLNAEDDDEEGSESDSDSTYYEEEDEESDSDDSSMLEDEESEAATDESDDASAVSWDELEQRAQDQDRRRSYSDDDEKPRKKSKREGGFSAPAAQPQRPTIPYGKAAVPPPRRF